MKQGPLKDAVGLRVNIMQYDGHLSSSNTDLEEQGTGGLTPFFGLIYGPDTGRQDHGNKLKFLDPVSEYYLLWTISWRSKFTLFLKLTTAIH